LHERTCRTMYLERVLCRNKKALLVPRPLSPKLPVPDHIKKPPYADSGVFPPWGDTPQVHDDEVDLSMRLGIT